MTKRYYFNKIGVLGIILIIMLPLPIFGISYISNTLFQPPSASVHFPIEFNATQAYEDVRTQLNFGFRVPGTTEHNACADWIRDELELVSDSVITHNFSLPGPDSNPIYCQNILGKLNVNKSNIIIISAHWDSRAIAEKDTINTTQPIPGANDGGSGVAVALELARVFYRNREEIESQLWFLFFDAEDQGSGGIGDWGWAEGANAFSDNLDVYFDNASESFSFLLLLDMVGGHDLQFVDEMQSNNELQQAVFDEGRALGYLHEFPKYPKKMWITDDHIYFRNRMPTLDLIIDFVSGDWTHHHTHQDNMDNIDVDSLYTTGATIESFLYSYHGQTTWNSNHTKWIIISAVGGFCILVSVTYLMVRRIKKKEKIT